MTGVIPRSLIAADRRHHTCLRDAREHCRPLQAARQVGKMTQVHQIWCQLCTKSFQNFSRSKHTIRTPNVVHNCFLPICFVGA